MPAAAHPSLPVSLGIAAFVVWRVYSRIRRAVGRQRLASAVRPWITVGLFPLLGASLLLGSIAQPLNALALVAGAGLGAVLGRYGLRSTRFEATPEGLFYTPNAHLGIALSLLLVARVAYRMLQLLVFDAPAAGSHGDFVRSPLTLAIFGTLAGYYVVYALGLLRWRARVRAAEDAATTSPPPG